MGTPKNFNIHYHDGWAMLTVTPRELQEREVYVDEVGNRMKLLGIPPVRMKLIQEILERASGEPEKLAPWPEGEHYSAKVKVEITEDAMEAWISAKPPKPGGEELTMAMIRLALEEQGITCGIESEKLQVMVDQGLYNSKVLAAGGSSPKQGLPARVKYHFITEKKPFKELRYGRIDLKELNFVQNRNAGDLLAEMVPPVKSVDGLTVTGQVLPAETAGEDEQLLPGENVELRDEKLYASIDGNACVKDGQVHMEPVLNLLNVDYSNGNIDFDGSVVIKGTVADGFEVKATGDIQVGKCVGRVKIHAGRSLMLRSGVNGDQEAQLFSGEDTFSRYVEGAALTCRGNLVVQESVMHSQLSVWGSVMLSGGRAELMGGSLLVQGSLWCRKLGGLYEPPTTVIIGVSPELLQEYTKLLGQVQKKRQQLDSADSSVAELKKHPFGHRDSANKTVEFYEQEVSRISEELGMLLKKSHQLREEALPDEKSILVVEDRIYGGVHLSFGFQDYPIGTNGVKQIVLRCIKGIMKEQGFNPADPPVL